MTIMQAREAGNQNSIFDDIRAGFLFIAENAQHVHIRHDRLAAYAQTLQALKPEKLYDLDHHYLGGPEDTLSYVLTSESVNFGSGFQPLLLAEGWELIDNSLYFSITTRLKKYYERNGALTAADLVRMDAEHCAAIFALDMSGPYSRKFVEIYKDAMHDLGALLINRYDGTFRNFVDSAGNCADLMIRRLAALPGYQDVHPYKGRTVPIYKRAQHSTAVLDIERKRLGLSGFSNIAQLTMFADNAVPHVLRTDGLLEYDSALEAHIESSAEIPSGAAEEVEIRGCAGHVVELLAAHSGVTARDIDFLLWHKSVEDPRYREKPTHRTLTRFY